MILGNFKHQEAKLLVPVSTSLAHTEHSALHMSSACYPIMHRSDPTRCAINNLPTEILSEIFLCVCDLPYQFHFHPKTLQQAKSLYKLPINLSHVSRHWRHVAFETGRLWTFIVISHQYDHQLDRLDAFVERSKELPLHVYISWTPTAHRPSIKDFDWDLFCEFRDVLIGETSERLLRSSSRWKSFEMTVETPRLMCEILERLKSIDAPLLTDVCLDTVFYLGEENENGSEVNIEIELPCYPFPRCDLRRLYLHETGPNWYDPPPYANLQSLTLDWVNESNAPSTPNFFNFLAASPLLEALVLRNFQLSDEPIPIYDGPIVDLPLLRHLAISGLWSEDGEVLVRQLRIPNVKVMEIDCLESDDTPWDPALTHLCAFYPSSSSALDSIQVLSIGQLDCRYKSLQAVFERLVNLRVLVVDCFRFKQSDWFLPLLEATTHIPLPANDEQPLWLPLLTTFVFSGIHGALLEKLVQLRKGAGVQPRHVFVTPDTTCFSVANIVAISRDVELFGELPSSKKGHVDISLEDLLTAHLRAEKGGAFFESC